MPSLLNTTIARTIVQSEKLTNLKGCGPGEPPTRPPLHPILLVRALAIMHNKVAELLLSDDPRILDWNSLMAKLRLLSHDPNWRRRPSVLDQIQGLTAPPGRRRNDKADQRRVPAR